MVSRRRMSRLSHALLGLLDPRPIIRRRKENFALLLSRLGSVAFLVDEVPDYAPFGFPIRLDNGRRDVVLRALCDAGIFAACHWKTLPSPRQTFAIEHRLADELLTLPCDQRYGPSDMALVADMVEDALA